MDVRWDGRRSMAVSIMSTESKLIAAESQRLCIATSSNWYYSHVSLLNCLNCGPVMIMVIVLAWESSIFFSPCPHRINDVEAIFFKQRNIQKNERLKQRRQYHAIDGKLWRWIKSLRPLEIIKKVEDRTFLYFNIF